MAQFCATAQQAALARALLQRRLFLKQRPFTDAASVRPRGRQLLQHAAFVHVVTHFAHTDAAC